MSTDSDKTTDGIPESSRSRVSAEEIIKVLKDIRAINTALSEDNVRLMNELAECRRARDMDQVRNWPNHYRKE